MRIVAMTVGLGAIVAGCSSPIPAPDVLGADAAASDAGRDAGGEPMDGGLDAPFMAVDTSVPFDTGVPSDTGSDAPVPLDSPPSLRGCDAIYGASAAYRLCSEAASSCTFYVDPAGAAMTTCNAICSTAGGSCMGAFDEGPTGSECAVGAALGCGSSWSDGVCVCSRIP